MVDERKISLCLTNYNRTDLLYEAFEQVYGDDRISEIIISDDHSSQQVWDHLNKTLGELPKIRLFRNEQNVDCYRNKKLAIERATNEWVIIFDSDNILTREYIDRLYEFKEWNPRMIYAPTFARPTFDYRITSGHWVDKSMMWYWMNKPMFDTALNTFNFFINREEYLKVWDGSVDPVTADSIYFNYCWLKAGNMIHFVRGLEYDHRVHEGSHYKNNVHRTPSGFYEETISKLKSLS